MPYVALAVAGTSLVGAGMSYKGAQQASADTRAFNQMQYDMQMKQMQQDRMLSMAGINAQVGVGMANIGAGAASGAVGPAGAVYAFDYNQKAIPYNDQQRAKQDAINAEYAKGGMWAYQKAQSILTGETDVSKDPLFQRQVNQGTKAVEMSALGRGGLYSGGTAMALQDYAMNSLNSFRAGRLSELGQFAQAGPTQYYSEKALMSGAADPVQIEKYRQQALQDALAMKGPKGGGGCGPGYYYERREKGDMDPSGTRELAAGEEYCLPNKDTVEKDAYGDGSGDQFR